MTFSEVLGKVFSFDLTALEWLQGFAGDTLTTVANIVTYLGAEFILLAIAAFFYWSYNKEMGKFIGTNLVISLVAAPLIKSAVKRPRPNVTNDSVKLLAKTDKCKYVALTYDEYSFMTQSSLNTVSVYGSLVRCAAKAPLAILAVLITLVVGVAEVYLGGSYPTDVLCGLIAGYILMSFTSWMQKKIQSHLTFAIIFGIVTIPGWFFSTSDTYFKTYGILIGVLFGFFFESAVVKFPNTTNLLRRILRFVCGLVITVALTQIMSLVVPKIFTAEQIGGGDLVAHAILTGQYFLVSFIMVAVYPAFFHLTAKIGRRGSKPKRIEE